MEDNEIVSYELLEHQADAVNRLNGEHYIDSNTGKLLKKEGIYDKHRAAGAVQPTGTGKSFIAMAEMIAINNKNYKGITKTIDEQGYERYHINIVKNQNGTLNESKIVYVAPTNEIAEQIKTDIITYIAKMNPDKMTSKEKNEIVRRYFPNLTFRCYKTLGSMFENTDNKKEGAYNPYDDTPDLVILDEVHRSGASTFQKGTAALLGCKVENGNVVQDPNAIPQKKNIKVLSISATPERDVDGKDMTKEWSQAIGGYTEKELSDEERADLAIKMTLPDAINKGILQDPNVVYFDCNLGETDDYRYLVRMANNEKIDIGVKEEAQKLVSKINNEVIGIPNYDKLNDKEKEDAREERITDILAKAIIDGKFDIHGKYIVFAPKNKTGKEIDKFLEDCGNQAKKRIEKALEKAGITNEIDVSYIYSKQNDEKNADALNKFDSEDKEVKDKGHIRIIVAQEKFNEGIHPKNISGGFNTRSIMEQDNTKLRAQSILFLQQKGRMDTAIIPGKTPPPKPTIFDICNNFYTQNINGAIDKEQRIPIFKLTDTQKLLHDAYKQIRAKLPKNEDITTKLPKLLETIMILKEYGIEIDTKKDLSDLLKKNENRDEIYSRLEQEGLLPKKSRGNGYNEYKVGKVLQKCREAFWEGKDVFNRDSITSDHLELLGIFDENTETFQNAYKKGLINDDRFIVMKAPKKFMYINTETGTKYSIDGVDIDGFRENQFDEESGLDENGFDRRGFNPDGIHKYTGTIHNIRGFMANGINILTGTEYDLDGYNEKGIKPFRNEEWIDENGVKHGNEIVGGFDRQHRFHPYNKETNEFVRTPTGYYAPYGHKNFKSVDEFGFDSKSKINCYTKTRYDEHRFQKIGDEYVCYRNGNTKCSTNSLGRDVAGYDEFGFNSRGIHKYTGTRFNPKGEKYEMFSVTADRIRETIRDSRKISQGMFVEERTNKKYSRFRGFSVDGINTVTGLYHDFYGFSLRDYWYPEISKNRYGFSTKDVSEISKKGNVNRLYKGHRNSIINILCTDKSGKLYEESTGKIGDELHPSLITTKEYIEKVVHGQMSEKKFYEEYAIKNKLLVNEAKYDVLTKLNQAVTLYRICPELVKSKETKEVMKLLINSKEEKISKFFKNILGANAILKCEKSKLLDSIENINKVQNQTRNPEELKELISRKNMLEQLEQLQQNK